MKAVSYTSARENLASTMDRVCEDRDTVIITRKRQQSVVMMSLEDFEALQETAYLLRSPKNAKRLLEALSTSLAQEGESVQMADLRSEVLDSGKK
jgi:antitoxin YefM